MTVELSTEIIDNHEIVKYGMLNQTKFILLKEASTNSNKVKVLLFNPTSWQHIDLLNQKDQLKNFIGAGIITLPAALNLAATGKDPIVVWEAYSLERKGIEVKPEKKIVTELEEKLKKKIEELMSRSL